MPRYRRRQRKYLGIPYPKAWRFYSQGRKAQWMRKVRLHIKAISARERLMTQAKE